MSTACLHGMVTFAASHSHVCTSELRSSELCNHFSHRRFQIPPQHGPWWRVVCSDLPRTRQTLSLLLQPRQKRDGRCADVVTATGRYPAPEFTPLLRGTFN